MRFFIVWEGGAATFKEEEEEEVVEITQLAALSMPRGRSRVVETGGVEAAVAPLACFAPPPPPPPLLLLPNSADKGRLPPPPPPPLLLVLLLLLLVGLPLVGLPRADRGVAAATFTAADDEGENSGGNDAEEEGRGCSMWIRDEGWPAAAEGEDVRAAKPLAMSTWWPTRLSVAACTCREGGWV